MLLRFLTTNTSQVLEHVQEKLVLGLQVWTIIGIGALFSEIATFQTLNYKIAYHAMQGLIGKFLERTPLHNTQLLITSELEKMREKNGRQIDSMTSLNINHKLDALLFKTKPTDYKHRPAIKHLLHSKYLLFWKKNRFCISLPF